MSESKENFIKWYVETMAPLKANGDAGNVLLMVSFPLFERYLRKKVNCWTTSVSDEFCEAAAEMLGIQDFPNKRRFWGDYRHGLLHRATFKNGAGLSSKYNRVVHFDSTEDRFQVDPALFFDLVTSTILKDFENFNYSDMPGYCLPEITDQTTIAPKFCGSNFSEGDK